MRDSVQRLRLSRPVLRPNILDSAQLTKHGEDIVIAWGAQHAAGDQLCGEQAVAYSHRRVGVVHQIHQLLSQITQFVLPSFAEKRMTGL